MATLQLSNIHTFYGNIHALQGISIEVNDREIVTLIGANGAGKSTTLRTISGILQPRQGDVRLDGERINAVPPHEIVARGVCQVPEGRRIFSRMTVRENLEMGAFSRKDKGAIKSDMDRVFELFPRLLERASQKGGTLSGGEQQMLAIGRALMARPALLLLDEPSLGLAPVRVDEVYDAIRRIVASGVSVVVVEQDVERALAIADRAYLLGEGRVVTSGPAASMRASEEVRRSVLGL